jgi:hypothetical protein
MQLRPGTAGEVKGRRKEGGCSGNRLEPFVRVPCTLLVKKDIMPARNPRVNVVLEKPLYESVRRLAAKEKISFSLKIRDLIKEALEAQEDAALADFAEEREKTFRQYNHSWRRCYGR